MNNNFWNTKNKLFLQAPMEDVTDAAFRRVIAKYGKPDIMYTEFTSADGLNSIGKPKLIDRLIYEENQRPIVMQIFSSKPESIFKASKLANELGFDGVNINMGCPDKNVCGQGAGAALIKSPELASDIIKAALDGSEGLPICVKTRIGFSKIEYVDWLTKLLENPISGLIVHLRTRKEMSKVDAHWELAGEIVKLKDSIRPETKLIGNGDVRTLEQGDELIRKYKVEGVMIGKGMYGNPWRFNRDVRKEDLNQNEILGVLLEHIQAFEELLGHASHFVSMRKHFKSYLTGTGIEKEKMLPLLLSESADEAKKIINSLFN